MECSRHWYFKGRCYLQREKQNDRQKKSHNVQVYKCATHRKYQQRLNACYQKSFFINPVSLTGF